MCMRRCTGASPTEGLYCIALRVLFDMVHLVLYSLHAATRIAYTCACGAQAIIHTMEVQQFLLALPLSFVLRRSGG